MKKVFYAMSAALAATALLATSCTDKDAAAPVGRWNNGKDTIVVTPRLQLDGTIVAEAGLKAVKVLQKSNNSPVAWMQGNSRFDGNKGDYVYEAGVKNDYTIKIKGGNSVTGGFFGSIGSFFTGSDNDAYNIGQGDTLPVGDYYLHLTDKNDNLGNYLYFTVKNPSPPGTGSSNTKCSYTDLELIAGLALTDAGKLGWNFAKDTIKEAGNYFFERQTTAKEYGILRVKKLNADSAVLTLIKFARTDQTSSGSLDSTNNGTTMTATIYTANNKNSYFTITGTTSSSLGSTNTTLGTAGENLFCFIRSGAIILTGTKANTANQTYTNAVSVKFLPVSDSRNNALATTCSNR